MIGETEPTAAAGDRNGAVLLDLAGRLAGEGDPFRVLGIAAELIGRHLGVNRCGYAEIEPGADTLVIPVDWVDGVASAVGRHPLLRGSAFVRDYAAGRVSVTDDSDLLDLSDDVRAAMAAMECRATVAAPLIERGELVGLFAVQCREPRAWTADEVDLVTRTAAMTWNALRHAQTSARLRESEESFRLLADNIPGICWLAGVDGHAYWMNAQGRAYFGDTGGAEGDGEAVVHPDDYGAAMVLWARALATGEEIETTVRTRGADGIYRPFLSRAAPIRDAAGTVVRWCGIQIDLSERRAHDRRQGLLRAFQDEVRDARDEAEVLAVAARALAAHADVDAIVYAERLPGSAGTFRVRAVADGAATAAELVAFDRFEGLRDLYRSGRPLVVDDWRGTLPPVVDDFAGMPGARDAGASLNQPIVKDGRVAAVLSLQTAAPRDWSAADVDLGAEFAERLWSSLGRVRAEAALREREASQAFLIDWTDALRWVDTPDAIMTLTLARIGDHLDANRVSYAEFDDATETFTTRWDWARGCPSRVGGYIRLADVTPDVRQEWVAGRIVRYDDVATDPRADAAERAAYAGGRIGAFFSIPLVRGDTVRAILSVQSVAPRAWREGEVQLGREVGERTWVSLERARARAELEARDRDQRFVLDWLDGVRGMTDPAAILATTMARLGERLGAARVAYARIAPDGVEMAIVSEWRDGVPARLGRTYLVADLSERVRRAYLAGETMVSDDTAADPRFSAAARARLLDAGVAARIGVPLVRDGAFQAILWVDHHAVRRWSEGEVRLSRDVAERMWVLVHRAQAEATLTERERNQSFLIDWSDRVRNEGNPRAILATTLAMIGDHLGVSRTNYAEAVAEEAVADGAALEVLQEWREGTVSVIGQRFPLAALGERVMRDHLSAEVVVVRSVATDPRFDDGNRPLYEGVGVAAFVSVPLVRAGAIEAVLSVQVDAPRDWTTAEVQLLRDVADRTWAVVERARSEERMADSEALLTAFMDNAPLGMHLKDANGRYLRMNPELARQIAIPVERVVGHVPGDFLPPGPARRVIALEQRALAGEVASAEFHFPDREDYRALLAVVFPIGGPRGIARTGGFTLDLTQSKAAEAALQHSRDALHQSEKLTALGSLLAGVSHELNNPLSIVVAQAVMMERQAQDPDLAVRAAKIRKAADRCARIVQTFLAMARQKEPERAAVNLDAVVDAALELTGYGLRSDGVLVERHRASGLPLIAADPDQLHQIVVNLVINAQHAMQGQAAPRRLVVTTRVGTGARTVALEIEDSGPGVPDDVARRMFEPFFTTKDQGKGTGLGLSFSQGMAEAHGGRLELLPAAAGRDGGGDGSGARFRLTLPVDPAHVVPPAAIDERATAATPARSRALIVDDEPEIAEALADFLLLEGYACDIAPTGEAACARIAAARYDLIVSDLRMPGMDGPALHAWIVAEQPATAARLGFVTGDTLGTAVARFLARAGRPVLEKPFTPESVRAFLRAIGATVS